MSNGGVFSRGGRRQMTMGLSTVLGVSRRGFFIPYRYAADLPAPDARPPYAALAERFAEAEPSFERVLGLIDAHADALLAIGGEPPPAPRWTQDWFPRLDAAAAYAIVRDRAPARLVEVGSGHSTRFYARAVADGGLVTAITAIDPAPRADITRLDVDIVRATVQQADLTLFSTLAAGDILSIDSSHILMPGTDVDMLLNVVLPSLPPGVLVHVHDIFLPDGYPETWTWRGYNEQLGVAALIHGGGYRLIWSSRWAATRMAEGVANTVAARLPRPDGAFESSLWMAKGS